MNKPSSIELVVFDLGRVMIRISDGWADACRRASVAAPASLNDPGVRERVHRLTYEHEVGAIDGGQFASRVGEAVGLSADEVAAVMRAWLVAPFPGWGGLIDRLHARGLRTACLSNTNAIHWDLMTSPGSDHFLPLDRLHYRVASHLVGAYKPEPAIYEALEGMSGVAPGSILFYDDLEANCIGAERRGWQTLRVDHRDDPAGQVSLDLRRRGLLA